jgi:hypothetical protein
MDILFYGPNCGSGIEQIGFVYLLLLKSMGHNIDYLNSQDTDTQKTFLKDLIHTGDYDFIILNEANSEIFTRTDYINYPKNKVFNICHSNINIPNNVIALSLNYKYHLNTAEAYPTVFPLPYPFLFKYVNKKPLSERKYDMSFIGRWCEGKFHKKIRTFLLNILNKKMDYGIISSVDEKYLDIPANEVYNNLDTKYLLLPSTTECLSLVVGEAQVCGCIPIVLDTDYLEHEQFELAIKCFHVTEFENMIKKTLYENYTNGKNNTDKKYSQPWHIKRVKQHLEVFFGSENKIGNIHVLNMCQSMNKLALENAEIITKTKLEV